MDLKHYFNGLPPDAREALAKACETTQGHMRNVMYGYRPCSAELAALIEHHSQAAVRRWDMRPTDWHRIWPELIGANGAPAVEDTQREAA